MSIYRGPKAHSQGAGPWPEHEVRGRINGLQSCVNELQERVKSLEEFKRQYEQRPDPVREVGCDRCGGTGLEHTGTGSSGMRKCLNCLGAGRVVVKL